MYKHVRFESFPNRNLTKKRGRWKPGIENSIKKKYKNVRFESFPNRNLTKKRGGWKPGIENSSKKCINMYDLNLFQIEI